MDIIVLVLLLQAKHWYADFWIQSYAQTVRKGIYRDWVGISHTVDHVIGTLLALLIASLFVKLSPILILLCGVLDMIIHYHIDWIKVRFGTKDITTTRYWREFGVDQFAHQLTYILFIYILITY
jgi:hypothetical protein|tara:strand:+ start:376 stop:747 length:372 start_codon:yes stop_codon:yes gene_type:complete